MELNKLIVHQVIKEQKSKETDRKFSKELTVIDANSRGLTNTLLNSYKDDKTQLGIFNIGNHTKFPDYYSNYINSERTDEDFIEFTRDAMVGLEHLMSRETMSKGGYVVFIDYKQNDGQPFIGIFLIRKTKGSIFEPVLFP
ncbi:MAG: nucleoid-associated protein [Bacteroidota bacterium]